MPHVSFDLKVTLICQPEADENIPLSSELIDRIDSDVLDRVSDVILEKFRRNGGVVTGVDVEKVSA